MSSLYINGKDDMKIGYSRNGRRFVLHIGTGYSMRQGREVQRLIDILLKSERKGKNLEEDTIRDLRKLPKEIQGKIEHQKLFEFCTGPGASMSELKAITDKETMTDSIRYNYEKAWSRLLEYCPCDLTVSDFDKSACEDFAEFLSEDLDFEPKTIYERFKSLRRSFNYAQSKGAIIYNPFNDVRAGKDIGTPSVPVSASLIEEILPYCVDDETRLALVFGRFAGVRIPSEIQNLRWEDVEKDRFRILKGKTGSRTVPLFERVAVEIEKNRNDNSEWVFPLEHRATYSRAYWNIRRAIERAAAETGDYEKFKRWPKLLNSLRASCITDYTHKNFHEVTMNAIFGNSEAVRKKHYIKVREEEYQALLEAGRLLNGEKKENRLDLLAELLPLISKKDLLQLWEKSQKPL